MQTEARVKKRGERKEEKAREKEVCKIKYINIIVVLIIFIIIYA